MDAAHTSITVDRTPPSQFYYMRTAFSLTLTTILRQRRMLLAGIVSLVPVVIPLAIAFFSASVFAEKGAPVFSRMTEYLYLRAIVPILALFFGCMLIGEDVENQSMPYILTRPIPRFAWVVGKFFAYLVVASGIIIPSIALTYAACTTLEDFGYDYKNLTLLAHYCVLAVLGLAAYGSLCIFLGATTKRPIVIGVILLIPWQRFATVIPGMIELLTIEKYINTLLPILPTARERVVLQMGVMQFAKEELAITPLVAVITIFGITLAFLILTRYALVWREFTQAKS